MVIKSTAELESLTPEQLDQYKSELEAHKEALVAKQISEATESVKAEMQKEIEKVTTANKELSEQIEQLKEKTEMGKEIAKTLVEEIKENKDALKSIAKGESTKEVVVKADTLRASIATNPHDLLLDGIGQLARKARSLYEFFPKIQVGRGNHNGTIAYVDWDEATTVKAAAMVAEGAPFPESTATFKGYTLPLRKIGDTLPVSEEFLEDEVMAAAELDLFLTANVENKIDEQIVNGDNLGENLKGIFESVPAFTAAASGITDANIYDLAIKVMESITATGGAKYRPDFVAMNISDINKLKLKKDSDNNYIFDRQDERLAQLNIIEDNNVTANTLVVGDSRFARIYEMGGVVLSKGAVNAQFTEDMMTIKARKRLAFLIREADKTGFKKVTSISAALTTLAT
jgi:HK97 family phage major capsid protein